MEVLAREIEENMAAMTARVQGAKPAADDPWGRREREVRREGLRFGQARPTFRRHCDRLDDFAARFCWARIDYGVNDDRAKWGLFRAVEGAQSCLVIAGWTRTAKQCTTYHSGNTYRECERSSGQQRKVSR